MSAFCGFLGGAWSHEPRPFWLLSTGVCLRRGGGGRRLQGPWPSQRRRQRCRSTPLGAPECEIARPAGLASPPPAFVRRFLAGPSRARRPHGSGSLRQRAWVSLASLLSSRVALGLQRSCSCGSQCGSSQPSMSGFACHTAVALCLHRRLSHMIVGAGGTHRLRCHMRVLPKRMAASSRRTGACLPCNRNLENVRFIR